MTRTAGARRLALVWRRVHNDARISAAYQLYTASHGGRTYKLFVSLSTQRGSVEDWTERPRLVLGTVHAPSSLFAKREANVLIATDLRRRAEQQPPPVPQATPNTTVEPSTGPHPLLRLRLHLKRLHRLALEGDESEYMRLLESEAEVETLARLMREADEALTGKVADRPHRFRREAYEVLSGGAATLQLSDGGYSRVGVSVFESPQLWLDRGLSTPRVVATWDSVLPRGG